MDSLTQKQKWLVGGLFLAFMMLTRSHMITHLQDASWAIFFLVGFYWRSHIAFGIFMVAAVLIDLAVVQYTNISNYCMTPSYPFIIPAYATLWFAGRFFANHSVVNNVAGLLKGALLAVSAIIACFMITNAGFYVFSGHFESMTVTAYVQDVSKYLPAFMKTTLMYLSFAAFIHWSVSQLNKLSGNTTSKHI
jgi:hypothetical protein